MTTDRESAAPGTPPAERRERILLLVEDDTNRRLLADRLAGDYEVLVPEDRGGGDGPTAADGLPAAFDLALADGTSFARHRAALAARKAAVEPAYLPYLLLVPEDGQSIPTAVRGAVDDVARRPVEPAILLDRIRSLLDARARSLALQRRGDRLDRVASTLAHDVRNPLSVARGYLEEAVDTGSTDPLEASVEALDRVEAIVERTLEAARRGADALDPAPVALAAVAADARESVDVGEPTVELPDSDRRLVADPDLLQQLLENLLRNAVEHADPGATVRVEWTDGGFAVADDGPGFPPDLEDAFAYGESDDGGTGFGLAIVREVAEAHGWSVDGADGDGRGARIEVTGVELA